jgi:hypothetical protein
MIETEMNRISSMAEYSAQNQFVICNVVSAHFDFIITSITKTLSPLFNMKRSSLEPIIDVVKWSQARFIQVMAKSGARLVPESSVGMEPLMIRPLLAPAEYDRIISREKVVIKVADLGIDFMSILRVIRKSMSVECFKEFIDCDLRSVFRLAYSYRHADDMSDCLSPSDKNTEHSNERQEWRKVLTDLFRLYTRGRSLGFPDYTTAYHRFPVLHEYAIKHSKESINGMLSWALSYEHFIHNVNAIISKTKIEASQWAKYYHSTTSFKPSLSEVIKSCLQYEPLPPVLHPLYFCKRELEASGSTPFNLSSIITACLRKLDFELAERVEMRLHVYESMNSITANLVNLTFKLMFSRRAEAESILLETERMVERIRAKHSAVPDFGAVMDSVQRHAYFLKYAYENKCLIFVEHLDTKEKGDSIKSYFEKHLAIAKYQAFLRRESKRDLRALARAQYELVKGEFELVVKLKLSDDVGRVYYVVQCILCTLARMI